MVKILVVDDEAKTRENVKQYLLRNLDCEVQEAAEGEQALARINETGFDLIILDIRLPGVSGIDILKKTREKNLNYLIISGWDSIAVAEEALNEGACDYIPKPFTLDILGQKVKQILSQKNK